MRLEHEFTVPATPDVVWAAVIDPARVAPCMPGATLSSVEGSNFAGGVKVKLGPVSLLYKGSGEFLEADEKARRVVIKASGKDSRGNGTAAATVTVTLSPDGAGTKGTVSTDLTITGKPAQFGRGMIAEVGGKILDTFAGCLAAKLGTDPAGADAASDTAATPTRAPRSAASKAAPSGASKSGPSADSGTKPAAKSGAAARSAPSVKAAPAAADGPADAADEPDEPGPAAPKPAARRRTQPRPADAAATVDGAVDTTSADGAHLQLVGELTPPSATATPAPSRPTPVAAAPETEAIDLLDYAGPSVLKRVLPVVAGVALLLIVRALRRRRR